MNTDIKAGERNKKEGFTLIELLVVIAIIGILSSVVLASLSGARQSAREANIIQNLSSAVTQGELYYNNNGSYDGVCDDSDVQDIETGLAGTSDDGAFCWEATEQYTDYRTELADFDWAVAATYDDVYYAASPQGVVTFDEVNSGSTNSQGWETAKNICANDDKRLPTASELRAIYTIESSTPTGFTGSGYWAMHESPEYPGWFYAAGMDNGWVYTGDDTYGGYVRCVS